MSLNSNQLQLNHSGSLCRPVTISYPTMDWIPVAWWVLCVVTGDAQSASHARHARQTCEVSKNMRGIFYFSVRICRKLAKYSSPVTNNRRRSDRVSLPNNIMETAFKKAIPVRFASECHESVISFRRIFRNEWSAEFITRKIAITRILLIWLPSSDQTWKFFPFSWK